MHPDWDVLHKELDFKNDLVAKALLGRFEIQFTQQ
jgi:hypothetical protein